MISRRELFKYSAFAGTAAGAGALLNSKWMFLRPGFAVPAAAGLSDPALQPKFVELAPNALDPGFLFKDFNASGKPSKKRNFKISAKEVVQQTGLVARILALS